METWRQRHGLRRTVFSVKPMASATSAHDRVREALRAKAKVRIEPVLPVDILGAWLLLPKL